MLMTSFKTTQSLITSYTSNAFKTYIIKYFQPMHIIQLKGNVSQL